MNVKVTLLLVVAALALGIVAYINPFRQEEELEPKPPWFYQVDMDDILVISIRYRGDHVKFVSTLEGTWAFDDPAGIPPSPRRWGGITLLLSGPRTWRDLTSVAPSIIENRAEYGLDDPDMIVDLGLVGDRWLQFRLGDKTTDGGYHYGEVVGFDELFLIVANWGDVLARLAYEPPLPKWYVKRTPEEIVGVSIYRGDLAGKDTPSPLRFEQKDGGWTVRDHAKDDTERPVDPERLAELLPIFPGPPKISVAVPLVDDGDYTPYGIFDDGNSIEIRFAGITQRGTRYVDGVLFRIGSKSPDETGYYAKFESESVREPVLLLPVEWTETILGLVDNIPYARESAPQAASQSN